MNPLIVLSIVFLVPLLGLAQTNSIEHLVGEALAHNHELQVYKAEIDAAKGQRTQAGLWKNPEFSGEYGEKRAKDLEGSLEGEGFARKISLTQTFEFPGKGSLRKAIATKNVEIAELGLLQFQIALAGQIRNLAYQYFTASSNAEAAQAISERSAELIESLKKRGAAGAQIFLETQVIEGSLIELQKSAKEFIQERDEARIELNTLLHRSGNESLNFQADIDPSEIKEKLSDLLAAALEKNYQLKIRMVELERRTNEVSASRLDAAPDFNVGPFYSEEKAQDREITIGVSASMPLPLWNWNQGNVATAKARHAQAEEEATHARHIILSEVSRRFRAYELTLQQLKKTPAETIQKLREAADFADRQYRLGAINIQLYLEVQRQFLSAQEIRSKALLEAWRNRLDLQLLTGAVDLPLEKHVHPEEEK